MTDAPMRFQSIRAANEEIEMLERAVARQFGAGVQAAIVEVRAMIPAKCSTPACIQAVSAWEAAIERMEKLLVDSPLQR